MAGNKMTNIIATSKHPSSGLRHRCPRLLAALALLLAMLATTGCPGRSNPGDIAAIQRAYLTGDYRTSQRLAHSCYDLNSGSSTGYEARYWEGMSLLALGNAADAQTPLQEASDSAAGRNTRILAMRGLAKAQLAAGDPAHAEETWLRIKQQYPMEVDLQELNRALKECAAAKRGEPIAKSGGYLKPDPNPLANNAPRNVNVTGLQGNGAYLVQAGIFSARDRADSLARQIQARGFSAAVTPVSGRFAVQCGSFPSKASAQARANQMRQYGFEAIVKE